MMPQFDENQVTDAEVHAARQILGYKSGQVRPMLESFLQGRAKPATAFTSAVTTSWCKDFPALAADLINHLQRKLAESESSAQEEITELRNAAQMVLSEFGTASDSLQELYQVLKGIRASKGEKT